MHFPLVFIFCTVLASTSSTWGWQEADTDEYMDGSTPVSSSTWKGENADKRNTWWTKKSLHNEELTSNGCIARRCSLMFSECQRQAENISVLMFCREAQYACLATCMKENRRRQQFNNVDSSS